MQSRLRLIGLAALIAPVGAGAQAPNAAAVRTEVQQVVRAYVEALNKADVATGVEMYSRDAGVTSVGDGKITRGWDAIRSAYDSIAGAEGKYKVSTGSIDVLPLGTGYALAVTSTIVTVKSADQEAQMRGAMTLVLKKVGAEWKIIHDHTSTITPTAPGGGGASVAPAPTAAPRPAPTQRVVAAPQPATPATPQPVRFTIAESDAADLKEAGFIYYKFTVAPSASCTVTGRIVGIAGGNKDFQAYIMDENSYLNWSTSHEAQTYWQSGQVAATNISAQLSGPQTYYLVISNHFSNFTPKVVKVLAQAEC